MILLFNKPFGILSQFTPDGSPNGTLAEFGFPPRVYPLGRLDGDSEGLLLLSDEPEFNQLLLHPKHGHEREYWVQVEGVPNDDAIRALLRGTSITGGRQVRAAKVQRINPPPFPPRDPPIRLRKSVPDSWISLVLREGKNRQVRRMTAAVGHPTLRLVRVRIGKLPLGQQPVGTWRVLQEPERRRVLGEEQ